MNHFIKIHDYLDASDCFPGVDIMGGINYFLYSKEYIGQCKRIVHQRDRVNIKTDYLNADGLGIIIRDPLADTIIKKVSAIEGKIDCSKSFSTYIGPRDYFTTKINGESILGTNWKGYIKEQDTLHPIRLYLNKQVESCGYGWISEKDILKNRQTLPFHKIYIPKAHGGDATVLGKPFYGEPNSVCSVTYLVIGYEGTIKDKEEAENIISYIKTKFFRFLVSIKKRTQDNPRDVFQFVPLQDWSKPWTDAELYAKYKLTKDEIAYIESMIKPMGGDDTLFDKDEFELKNNG